MRRKRSVLYKLLQRNPRVLGQMRIERWKMYSIDKCDKCLPEDHEGRFCRCEPRNIAIARELRRLGLSGWQTNQPERSKREDCTCPVMKRYTTGSPPKYIGEYKRCRCGALNIVETQ